MSGPRALAEVAFLQAVMRVQLSSGNAVLLDNPKTEYLHKHGGQFVHKPKNDKPHGNACVGDHRKKASHR